MNDEYYKLVVLSESTGVHEVAPHTAPPPGVLLPPAAAAMVTPAAPAHSSPS